MTPTRLAAAAIVLAGVGATLLALVSDGAVRPMSMAASSSLNLSVTLVGIGIWRASGVRDRLGLAWLAVALQSLMVGGGELLFGDGSRSSGAADGATLELMRTVFGVGMNLVGITAALMLANVWSASGLAPRWRWHALAISLTVALVVAGPTAFDDLMSVCHGRPDAIAQLASDIGDLTILAIIGPLAATGVALRGGMVAWPWLLLAASDLCWLAYDIAGRFPGVQFRLEHIAIPSAALFALAAGLSQLYASRHAAALVREAS